jgi:hypothetical protein
MLVGCTTKKSTSRPSVGSVSVSCPSDKALVYLYRVRPWVGSSEDIKMFANGAPVVTLRGHEYCPLFLKPGSVALSHEVDAGLGRHWLMNDLHVQLEAGQTYYVAYRFWVSPFKRPNPTMVVVDPETGKGEMADCAMKKQL